MRTWLVTGGFLVVGLLDPAPAHASAVDGAALTGDSAPRPSRIAALIPELAGGLNGLAGTPSPVVSPQESALFDGGLPLLGGLGGQPPANEVPTTEVSTGLPIGGLVVNKPAPRKKARPFSATGRPIAGVDKDYD
ncbi:MAG: hypothetical protein ABW000_16655 [Actinoplanes sp.]